MQLLSFFGLLAISAPLTLADTIAALTSAVPDSNNVLEFRDSNMNKIDQIVLTNENIRGFLFVMPTIDVEPENPLVITVEADNLAVSTC